MRKNNMMEMLLAMVLLTTFVGSSVYMVLLGTDAYQNMVEETKIVDRERTALAFVENQLRMSENAEDIEIAMIDETKCLIINHLESKHLIYVKDGYLKELMVKKDGKIFLDGGENIVECDNMEITKEDKTYMISLSEDVNKIINLR